MTEIHTNFYIGNEIDYEFKVKNQEGWSVVHACKEPYHRQALEYSGRGHRKINFKNVICANYKNYVKSNIIKPDDVMNSQN